MQSRLQVRHAARLGQSMRDAGALLACMHARMQTPAGYNEWNVTDNMVEFHLKAMERQLRSMYYGFALAYTLNRTLILPKVCGGGGGGGRTGCLVIKFTRLGAVLEFLGGAEFVRGVDSV